MNFEYILLFKIIMNLYHVLSTGVKIGFWQGMKNSLPVFIYKAQKYIQCINRYAIYL